jgi:hypothetical protein
VLVAEIIRVIRFIRAVRTGMVPKIDHTTRQVLGLPSVFLKKTLSRAADLPDAGPSREPT